MNAKTDLVAPSYPVGGVRSPVRQAACWSPWRNRIRRSFVIRCGVAQHVTIRASGGSEGTSKEQMPLVDRIDDKSAHVAVIGLGYVGLPLAVAAARSGYPVTGFDVDAAKMSRLDQGRSYIEGVSDAALEHLASERRFDWTTDFGKLATCDIIVICVPTPLSAQRTPDLRFVRKTARTIAQHVKAETLVVLESTTYPGTTEEVLVPLLQQSGLTIGKDLFVGFSPEREDPGNPTYSTTSIPKIVAGLGHEDGDLIEKFYTNIVETVVRVADTRIAEAIKITENIFRAVNIALVNEMKLIYDAMNIDVWAVIDGASTKPFGYMPFYPGPGLGGHCIPIDPFYLAWKAKELDVPARFIELAGEINTAMPAHVIARTREIVDRETGKGLSTCRILLVGVAYKKNVSDMRESPAMKLMDLLEASGAVVDYLDPLVPVIPKMRAYPHLEGRVSTSSEDAATRRYDAALIATDHDSIDFDALARLDCLIVDTRNAMARRDISRVRVFKV